MDDTVVGERHCLFRSRGFYVKFVLLMDYLVLVLW